MKSARIILLFILSFMLIGCAYFSSPIRQKSYLSARSIPPMKMPPGIASNSFHNAYPISDRNYPYSEEDISLVPPGL